MDISTYLETARQKAGLSSNNQLSRLLGLSQSSLSWFMTGRTLPTDETMLKIADCANIPAEKALVDLAIWRNKKNADVVKAWQNIRAKLAH